MLLRIIVGGVAIALAALIVPSLGIRWGTDPVRAIAIVGLLGLIIALVDRWLRPILRLVSLPLNLLTLGLFSVLLNAALIFVIAGVAATLLPGKPPLTVGAFPWTIDTTALVAAFLGSVVVSASMTVISLVSPGV